VLGDTGALCVAIASVTCLKNKANCHWAEEWYVRRKTSIYTQKYYDRLEAEGAKRLQNA